jgi:hypothetical protein
MSFKTNGRHDGGAVRCVHSWPRIRAFPPSLTAKLSVRPAIIAWWVPKISCLNVNPYDDSALCTFGCMVLFYVLHNISISIQSYGPGFEPHFE